MTTITEIQSRWNAPTPRFFKKIQKLGLTMVGVGSALLAAPVALPAVAVSLGGYLITCGTVLSAVTQMARETPEELNGSSKKQDY